MNPNDLLPPLNPLGYPAPYWFIVLLKVFGFFLHIIPMSLWYAGILIALLMHIFGKDNGKIFARRLMTQMPIIVAAGINLGIVPLLFTQVAYYRVFYPATILMGWLWFGIIILLIIAYYGIYIYASAYKNDNNRLTLPRIIIGWISSFIFIIIGFIFANAFSLMVNLDSWHNLWLKTQIGGAVLGIGNNFHDPTLFPRWLMMFGLAIMTTGIYAIFDASYLAKKEDIKYKLWIAKFALITYIVGIFFYVIFGSLYIFITIDNESRRLMLTMPVSVITWLTAFSPSLPFLLILSQFNGLRKFYSFCAILFHLVVLSLNSISRQLLQNLELNRYFDVTSEPVNLQSSPMIIFLVLFILTLSIGIYLLTKKSKAT